MLIDNFRLVERGRFREKELETLLTDHPWPVRNLRQNIADLKAQIAANEKGVAELRKMVAHFGLDVVEAYMGHVQDNAAESVRRVLERLPDHSEYEYPTDTGQVIKVKIAIDRDKREATVDFTGTSPVMKNNFNAPEPVARAAVLYAFRVMVEDMIPMNAGCLRPINIIIPEGSMLRPAYPAAVVAGNVETSQHVTNALFAAMGALANAQGTMNNLTFGNATYQYYETICSGSPAGRMNDGRGFAGTSGVHTHMTNSRLTDPEVLELRFPVLLEDFHIRQGSGGNGKWRAGDGTRRTIRFLEKMECAILSSHRSHPPLGLDGGGDGQAGRPRSGGSTAASRGCAPATRRCWRPAKPSSSRRRPRGDMGGPEPRRLPLSPACHAFHLPASKPASGDDSSDDRPFHRAQPAQGKADPHRRLPEQGGLQGGFFRAAVRARLLRPRLSADLGGSGNRHGGDGSSAKAIAWSPSPRAAATSSPISRARRLPSTRSTSTRRISR